MRNQITFPAPETHSKGWGAEQWLINCPDYCAKLLQFNPGSKSSSHFHLLKRETWYVLNGEIELTWIDTEDAAPMARHLMTGDIVDIPRLCPHQVRALTSACILEVSTQHFEDDSYRISPGDSQNKP